MSQYSNNKSIQKTKCCIIIQYNYLESKTKQNKTQEPQDWKAHIKARNDLGEQPSMTATGTLPQREAKTALRERRGVESPLSKAAAFSP